MNHNQTIPVRRFNAFTARLTIYMIDFHPDRIDEVDFIDQRGQMAADVFHQCSVRGMTVDESMHEAEKALYAGLHFSPYLMLEEIVYNHFRYTDEEEVLGYFSQFINKDVIFTGDKPDVVIGQGNIFKVNLRHGINASRETVPSVTVFYKNPDRTWVSRMTVDWQDAGRIKLADGKVQQVQADNRGKETDSPEATRRFRR
jgi:hypothetical protein